MSVESIRFVSFVATLACALPVAADESDGSLAPEDQLAVVAEELVPKCQQVGETQCEELKKRQTAEIQVTLPRAGCYTFLALATSGISDLSMSIYADGREVASDRISGKRPMTKWCSAGPEEVTVALTAYCGSGVFAFGVFEKPHNPPQKAERVGGPLDDIVANRIRQLHTRYGNGRAAISPVYRGNLSKGKQESFGLRLKGGHCYTLIASGDQASRALQITLRDAQSRNVASAHSTRFFATADTQPCIKQGGQFTVDVKMKGGSGQFGVQVFSD